MAGLNLFCGEGGITFSDPKKRKSKQIKPVRFAHLILFAHRFLYPSIQRFGQIKNPAMAGLGLFCGEGGIRTHGTVLPVRRFSKPFLSATQAPLQLSFLSGSKNKDLT